MDMHTTAASLDQAMNFRQIQTVIRNGPPGATLPSALPDDLLIAAIHDLHEYYLRLRDTDSEGNHFLAGPMCLLRKLLKDKGLHVPGDLVLDLLEIYQSELEFESMMRNDPNFRIERATLDNIFESERESVVGRPSSDSEVVLDRRLPMISEDPIFEDEHFDRILELLC